MFALFLYSADLWSVKATNHELTVKPIMFSFFPTALCTPDKFFLYFLYFLPIQDFPFFFLFFHINFKRGLRTQYGSQSSDRHTCKDTTVHL